MHPCIGCSIDSGYVLRQNDGVRRCVLCTQRQPQRAFVTSAAAFETERPRTWEERYFDWFNDDDNNPSDLSMFTVMIMVYLRHV